ncbi:hypothetical protein WICPIJ_008984 [Wickerhamomyces pijperi]|uniref:NEDD8-activating enzyme E1 regulatory subunit n=1 Tax=Wickerhamomyces pijperi TaxID=599730 RepID=A0A9P8TFV7_WICPI|nr:hypothetical protein WICPIJ_008984 [Wickerhamomyces pijperi]
MSKEEKYDRQLRLWQSSGQSNLEHSRIVLVSPNLASLELMKNLILPGLGHFTILDSEENVITEEDLSNNFYITEDQLGLSKAEVFASNLNELNLDSTHEVVKIEGTVQDFLASDDLSDKFPWNSYDFIVANWQFPSLIDLVQGLSNTSLIVVNSLSFFGTLRIFQKSYKFIETHSEKMLDLRLLNPWKELTDYSDSIDLEALDLQEHSQIPFLIIQLKAMEEYKRQHGGELPKAYSDRKVYKAIIQGWKKSYDELNFDEALTNSNKIFNPQKVPEDLQKIFDSLEGDFDAKDKYWLLVKALKIFVDSNDGNLPLTGEIPDMDSTTENYMTLKGIYKDKFSKDLTNFEGHLQELNVNEIKFTTDEIVKFIKNSKYLYYSKLSSKLINNVDLFIEDFGSELSEFQSIILSFIMIENYYLQFNTIPSLTDINALLNITKLFLNNKIQITETYEKVLYEILRVEGKELANISSIMGGIGAQELLKLITLQYKPLDDFLVFDGIRSVSERYKIK